MDRTFAPEQLVPGPLVKILEKHALDLTNSAGQWCDEGKKLLISTLPQVALQQEGFTLHINCWFHYRVIEPVRPKEPLDPPVTKNETCDICSEPISNITGLFIGNLGHAAPELGFVKGAEVTVGRDRDWETTVDV